MIAECPICKKAVVFRVISKSVTRTGNPKQTIECPNCRTRLVEYPKK